MPYRIQFRKTAGGNYETVAQIGLGPTPMLGGFVTFIHHGHQITGRITTSHTDRPKMATATAVDTVFVEEK